MTASTTMASHLVEDTNPPVGSTPNSEVEPNLELIPLISLVCQHFSSSWGERTYEFASYLYLIVLFPTTLIPASILGFTVTVVGLSLSGQVGHLVDKYRRLQFVRGTITCQKILQATAYGLLLVLFLRFPPEQLQSHGAVMYVILSVVIVISSILGLATAGLNVAIQRDWVFTIAAGSSTVLTKLNTYLRRVDLLCKLVAPLFVSLLTTTVSYPGSVAILLGISMVTLLFELVWIAVVWNRFGILAAEENRRMNEVHSNPNPEDRGRQNRRSYVEHMSSSVRQQGGYFKEFARLPVFTSSLAIALVYFTTLSFDGIMISYLKVERSFSDAFIAAMRGVCVVTGLCGTILMPWLDHRLGLVRAGTWSLWSQIICLIPVVISLFVPFYSGSNAGRGPGPVWASVLLFLFLALSRIGLWSFDLIQLQILQESLASHPRRNALMGIQLSLQNAFDLGRYSLVLVLNKPEQFHWTALASWIAVFSGGIFYASYVYKVRGHLIHWYWMSLGSRTHVDER